MVVCLALYRCSDGSCGTDLASLVLGGVCAPALSLTTFLWPTPNVGCTPAGTFTPSGLGLERSGYSIGATLDALQAGLKARQMPAAAPRAPLLPLSRRKILC